MSISSDMGIPRSGRRETPLRKCRDFRPDPSERALRDRLALSGRRTRRLWIYQQAWFSWGELEAGTRAEYALKSPGSFGVYVFVIDGEVEVAGQSLSPHDGLGVSEMDPVSKFMRRRKRVSC